MPLSEMKHPLPGIISTSCLFGARWRLLFCGVSVQLILASLLIFADGNKAYADDADIPASGQCGEVMEAENLYTICRFDVGAHDVRLFHRDEAGTVFGYFSALESWLPANGHELVFAMNAGMYDKDYRPVGLYAEGGALLKAANTNDGPGNFHLKPNGIFYLLHSDDGVSRAGVMETGAFLDAKIEPFAATQSGPMLVIDGELHPKFLPQSTSRKKRNGVGVSADGKTIWFAISEKRVTFHQFGSLFRDRLGTPQALFLDGTISKLYAKELGRHDKGLPVGPIVAVVKPVK